MLADHLGISYWTISKYETDVREPDFSMLIKIADFFNVTTDYLLGRSNYKNTLLASENHIPYFEGDIAAHRSDDPRSDLPKEAIISLEEFEDYLRKKFNVDKK
jgi:transcriptional regulator with XRE-family HTH domain